MPRQNILREGFTLVFLLACFFSTFAPLGERILGALIQRSKIYCKAGFGMLGSLLKHSLVPLPLFRDLLPSTGLVLDLGCGEGMLSNLVATEFPKLEVVGVDLDAAKVHAAHSCRAPNARFQQGNILNLESPSSRAVIINDVLHHLSDEEQKAVLVKAHSLLEQHGLLLLKEVDPLDKADTLWTRFWDSRLYPSDELNFQTEKDWKKKIFEAGFQWIRTDKVKHPWPASRTLYVCRKRAPKPSYIPKSSTPSVLVTGATGFIGAHLVQSLATNGLNGEHVSIVCLVRDKTRVPPMIEGVCEIWEKDLLDLSADEPRLRDFDYVFHLAAEKDFFGGKEVHRSNIRSTENLVRGLQNSSKLKKFIFASSVGAVDRPSADSCSVPLDEKAPCFASSPYGRSKFEGEKFLKASGIAYATLRIPWCFGPGMSKSTHVRRLVEMVSNHSLATRFDWPGKINLISVEECVRALKALSTLPSTEEPIYFVTQGDPITFGELFRSIGKLAGNPKAGTLALPLFLSKLFYHIRKFLPFTLRALVADVFWVSDYKLRQTGFLTEPLPNQSLLPLVRWVNRLRFQNRHDLWVLISGAASGIGKSLALQWAAKGYRLLLVDKNPDVLEFALSVPGARAIVADLATDGGVTSWVNAVREFKPHCVVHCAGIGIRSVVGETSSQASDRLLNLNIRAVTRGSEIFLKTLSQSESPGTLVNIASSSAYQPLPGMASYSASKTYVLHFTEAIQYEYRNSNICVIGVCPSGVDSGFQEASGVRKDPSEKLLTPDFVASKIIRRVEAGRSGTLVLGSRTWLSIALARIMPRRWNLRLWGTLMESLR